MSGALMFIIYGDPSSTYPPTLSVRTTPGHAAPIPIAEDSTGKQSIEKGFDTQVLKSEWISDDSSPDTVMALISVAIRSATLWGGTDIDMTAPLQPFIWAYSPTQSFNGDFRANTDLKMHDHQTGYGNFYMDLSSSFLNATIETPPAPSIIPNRIVVAALDRAPDSDPSSTPAAMSFRNLMWHIHGAMMTFSFLLLFPAGILAIRSGHAAASFSWHWRLQLAASVLALLGMALGLLLSRAIVLWHQFVGLVLIVALPLQVWAGWRHHVGYVEYRSRTRFISDGHIWLGRVVLVAGWVNLVTGLLLRGYGYAVIGGMGMTIVGEALGLGWAWDRWRVGRGILAARSSAKAGSRRRLGEGADADEQYFALVDQDQDQNSDEESDLDVITNGKDGDGIGVEGKNLRTDGV